jgi:YVTN family beta-propeller protein
MNNRQSWGPKAIVVFYYALWLAVLMALPAANLCAQSPTVTQGNWGAVSAPVYGTSEKGAYEGAELFAGPNKFGSYFSGVLPNGRVVKPAGTSVQVGTNPLGIALTPDGKYLVTSNDDEREKDLPPSYRNAQNRGGYSLSVIDTGTMKVVSQYNVAGKFFIGLQVTGSGPYTVWASGGPDNDVKLFTVSSAGEISPAGSPAVAIRPFLPSNKGYVSIYQPAPRFNKEDKEGNLPPVPSQFKRLGMTQITYPAGSALSPDGHYLYVACNGDNSVAVIDTHTLNIVRQIAVGYFPYSVSVSANGENVAVSNWGITEYKFKYPTYDKEGNLAAIGATGRNAPDGFYVPVTNAAGPNPKTSSVSLLRASQGDGSKLVQLRSVYQGHRLDSMRQIGDTHPSATAIVHHGSTEVLYVTKSNSDSLGAILLGSRQRLPDVDLSPISIKLRDGHEVHGAYPNALAVSPDNNRMYVAEAGINSVAVLDVSDALHPILLGRIPTGWYPSAVAVSSDGHFLYVANAKGIGEDINPNIKVGSTNPPASGIGSDPKPKVDSNYVFGTVQKIDLQGMQPEKNDVLQNNFSIQGQLDSSIVPLGGARSKKIKHVFFILHENKTFDSMLGNMAQHFGPFASLTYNDRDGSPDTNDQYTGVSVNLQAIAGQFAAGVNYYSDSEESDAGHQFAASGTATDYTEKTLLVKSGRGLLVNKNFEPEDYPEGGYIFNNAARHGISFKDYGALVRIAGSDTGTSIPTKLNDRSSGKVGYPRLADDSHVTNPLRYAGDVTSPTVGLGQSYFLALPILAILGTNNLNGEPRLDHNYPGYNFNISDRRRARKFIADFDRMARTGKLPDLLYIYQPNDHTGTEKKKDVGAPNADDVGTSAFQQVADGDAALGMVVQHIMKSRVYYDPKTGEGSAIFITWDDAQSSLDHIHPHRTPLLVISPYAKSQYLAKKHYSTASIVKTEELLLGLPPNNLGDLFATDLRDMFQSTYNGVKADAVKFNLAVNYTPSPEGERIWSLVENLDTSAPDRDSHRLGVLIRLSAQADELHNRAAQQNCLECSEYRMKQKELLEAAIRLAQTPAREDSDD